MFFLFLIRIVVGVHLFLGTCQLDLHLSELFLEVAHSFLLGFRLLTEGVDDLIKPLDVLLMLYLFLRNSSDLVDTGTDQC